MYMYIFIYIYISIYIHGVRLITTRGNYNNPCTAHGGYTKTPRTAAASPHPGTPTPCCHRRCCCCRCRFPASRGTANRARCRDRIHCARCAGTTPTCTQFEAGAPLLQSPPVASNTCRCRRRVALSERGVALSVLVHSALRVLVELARRPLRVLFELALRVLFQLARRPLRVLFELALSVLFQLALLALRVLLELALSVLFQLALLALRVR